MPNKKRLTGYDERPDPGRPGQQGVLFRRTAPAQDQDKRNHIGYKPVSQYSENYEWAEPGKGKYAGKRVLPYDTRMMKGRVTGYLNPEDLMHGSNHEIEPGDSIRPGEHEANDMLGHGEGLTENGRRLHAYATPSRMIAEEYGRNVYDVRPTGPVHLDPEYMNQNDPMEIEDQLQMGEFPAVRSKYPFRVLQQHQFGSGEDW